MAISPAIVAAQHNDIGGVYSPLAPRVIEISPVAPPASYDRIINGQYSIVDQEATILGQVRVVQQEGEFFSEVEVYVTVIVGGEYVWRRAYMRTTTLDATTGQVYDPLKDFGGPDQ